MEQRSSKLGKLTLRTFTGGVLLGLALTFSACADNEQEADEMMTDTTVVDYGMTETAPMDTTGFMTDTTGVMTDTTVDNGL